MIMDDRMPHALSSDEILARIDLRAPISQSLLSAVGRRSTQAIFLLDNHAESNSVSRRRRY